MSKILKPLSLPNALSLFRFIRLRAMSEAAMPESLIVPNDENTKRQFIDEQAEENDSKKLKIDESIRVRRKKVALMMSYCGTGYLGMQRNKGTKTIEEDLMEAMLKAGLINDEMFETQQIIKFQRAARTDKGVSAARQVISLKLPDHASPEAINEHLPEQIRVMSIKRVTKGFDSKNSCDGRTYSYMLPTFAFTPKNEEMKESYRISSEVLSRVNDILNVYRGSHNFHNFTSKKKPLDPSAKRFIMDFKCETPFLRGDVEFLVLKVKGQSFMLHQIRKMVGLVIAIMKGYVPIEIFEKVWEYGHVDIPKAPGLGLLLEEVHYTRYNARFGKDGIHEPLDWADLDDKVNEFVSKYIHTHIVETELVEKPMLEWLYKLSHHDFRGYEDEEDVPRSQDDNENGNKSDDE